MKNTDFEDDNKILAFHAEQESEEAEGQSERSKLESGRRYALDFLRGTADSIEFAARRGS